MALSPGFLKFDGSKWIIDDVEGGSGPTIVNSGVGSLDNIVSLEGATPASVIIFTSSSPMSVTGISGGTESRELEVFNNNGAAKLTLKHENVGSLAENRIVCPGGNDFVLSYQESVTLVYNNVDARWRVDARGIPIGNANDLVGLDGAGGLISLGPLTTGIPGTPTEGQIVRQTSGTIWSNQDLPTLNNSSQGQTDNISSTGGSGAPVGAIRFTGYNDVFVTGISGGYDGRRLALLSKPQGTEATGTVTIYDTHSSSLSANQFSLNTGASTSIVVSNNSGILLQYDGYSSKWYVVGQPFDISLLPTIYDSLYIQNLQIDNLSSYDTFGQWNQGTTWGDVTTASVTPTEFNTFIGFPTNGVFMLEATVAMTRQTSATKAGIYKRIASYRVSAGTPTLIGSIVIPYADQETTAGDDVTIVISGIYIRVRVTAADTDPRRWFVEYKYKYVNA